MSRWVQLHVSTESKGQFDAKPRVGQARADIINSKDFLNYKRVE